MITYNTNNCQSNYNLRNPTIHTKHMPKPIITEYALILLKVAQDNKKDWGNAYTKKKLVSIALGHIHEKFKFWKWKSNSALSSTFAAFNHNNLLFYDKKEKKWYQGKRLIEYINYHFGPYTDVPLKFKTCYDDAVIYNSCVVAEWKIKKEKYKLEKKIGSDFFFQQ